MKFLVKVCDKQVLLDEAQLSSLVEILGNAELFNTAEYVGHNKGTYGKNMEYTQSIKPSVIHDWLDVRPLDMQLYGTLKLMQKLEDD